MHTVVLEFTRSFTIKRSQQIATVCAVILRIFGHVIRRASLQGDLMMGTALGTRPRKTKKVSGGCDTMVRLVITISSR